MYLGLRIPPLLPLCCHPGRSVSPVDDELQCRLGVGQREVDVVEDTRSVPIQVDGPHLNRPTCKGRAKTASAPASRHEGVNAGQRDAATRPLSSEMSIGPPLVLASTHGPSPRRT